MDAKRLQEIKARHEATTPGRWWKGCTSEIYAKSNNDNQILALAREILFWQDEEFFIRAHNDDIPDLVAEVEHLQAEVERLQQAERDRGETPDPRAGATGATVANYRIAGEGMGEREWSGEGGA